MEKIEAPRSKASAQSSSPSPPCSVHSPLPSAPSSGGPIPSTTELVDGRFVSSLSVLRASASTSISSSGKVDFSDIGGGGGMIGGLGDCESRGGDCWSFGSSCWSFGSDCGSRGGASGDCGSGSSGGGGGGGGGGTGDRGSRGGRGGAGSTTKGGGNPSIAAAAACSTTVAAAVAAAAGDGTTIAASAVSIGAGGSISTCAFGFSHLRRTHNCLRMPSPPNLGLSTQFLHVPQSARRQLAHALHGCIRPALGLAAPPLPLTAVAVSSRPSPLPTCSTRSIGSISIGSDSSTGNVLRASGIACVH